MAQRALARQVPPLVEKDWHPTFGKGLLRRVTYLANTAYSSITQTRELGRE